MSSESFNLKKLYEEKKYKEIVSVIKKIDDKSINSGLLNLLGVCKLLSDKSKERSGFQELWHKHGNVDQWQGERVHLRKQQRQ